VPLQPDQHTGVTDPPDDRLNPQQHVETAEFLIAHRHQRRRAPPGDPKTRGSVTFILQRGHFDRARTPFVAESAYVKFGSFWSEEGSLFNWFVCGLVVAPASSRTGAFTGSGRVSLPVQPQ
jgi:hypothetical protein